MTRQCTGDWRDYLHEQLYAVAVRVTGDQPQAHAIADAGLRAAEPVQHTADDRTEIVADLRAWSRRPSALSRDAAVVCRLMDRAADALADTALVRQPNDCTYDDAIAVVKENADDWHALGNKAAHDAAEYLVRCLTEHRISKAQVAEQHPELHRGTVKSFIHGHAAAQVADNRKETT